LCAIERLAVAGFVGHAQQVTLVVERPGVVEALEDLGNALRLPTDDGTAMRAGIVQGADHAIGAADEDEWHAGDAALTVLPRLLQFRFVAQVEPALVE